MKQEERYETKREAEVKHVMKDAIAEDFSDSVLQMATETLLTLADYSEVLENLSIRASELLGTAEFHEQFLKLIDGIGTFTDSITQVKTVLNKKPQDTVAVLESDLASLLKDLLECQDKGDLNYEKILLKTYLPANLKEWRVTGIPTIQVTRDC